MLPGIGKGVRHFFQRDEKVEDDPIRHPEEELYTATTIDIFSP